MYLLDTNVFIEAKNRYYGLDFCPAFWECLTLLHDAQKVFSIDKVQEEIRGGADELSDWIEKLNASFFISSQESLIRHTEKIRDWLHTQQYATAGIRNFMESADIYLIAQALTSQAVLVTKEVQSKSKKEVKIPDVCNGLRLKHCSTFEMLREAEVQFILKKPSK